MTLPLIPHLFIHPLFLHNKTITQYIFFICTINDNYTIPPAGWVQLSFLRSPVLNEGGSGASAECHNYRVATSTTTAAGMSTDLPLSALWDRHKTSRKVSVLYVMTANTIMRSVMDIYGITPLNCVC